MEDSIIPIDTEQNQEQYFYHIGAATFEVLPIYLAQGEEITTALIKLMKSDIEHENTSSAHMTKR